MSLMRAVFDACFTGGGTRLKPAGPRWPLLLFHVDTGGCGGCGMELEALAAGACDMRGAGFGFVKAPQGADVLLITGALTRAMAPVIEAAWKSMPLPKGLICVGDCAFDGGFFTENYAVMGGVQRKVQIDLTIPGCPPPPQAVLDGLCSLFSQSEAEASL
ncbi:MULTISPECIES: NADH-quinone oxidoreductase subunit B family protein [Acetobacter]|uniref:NADH-quinone oxidoreductase subunit B n=1 Tax=Acetobacter thailandicus TaxID=1502842 RepID=A0ABT3QEV7_9PROT|nr:MULTISPECIES: NADH-quinone oxidoreductase subunit B [Acetobacter]MBS0959961.1 NADH-quinone oxidoreductase subunit B [Acetobacter thailandicus]MBS0979290.1 NADH-quinone oxidoreductase subunit B [Acetobacter thailandicus]MBS0985704.1 NADH-quinone oxidoreductase subunit B [Acetobacter thailandicus]MBS1002408.1 NADH-quinone oxidoreductase subunit B [Acetobacter thailandicus]MCX2563820.1 NADH-quinone oxidoreductase subunit B [Acetobacter thailandicus]